MRVGVAKAVLFGVAGLWLAGCMTTDNATTASKNPFDPNTPGADASASATESAPQNADSEPTGSVPEQSPSAAANNNLLGSDPNDDLNLGKKNYRANNFGMAEKYFRRAVELHPRDAEAWMGLAACYDRLRRFELADRAYEQATRIIGPTVEILNNQGYSYMLRGDYKRAREKLVLAQRKDPDNKFVQNNLQLLESSARKGKGIE